MTGSVGSLSERERETLRLLARGHDAKSIAATLDLSVHTVNERLRHVRRKLGVSSSREAARLLVAHEAASEPPNNAGYKEIGVAGAQAESAYSSRSRWLAFIGMGVVMVAILTAVLMSLRLSGADAPALVDVASRAQSMVNPPSVFAPADYPADALAQRTQGSVRYRLDVSEVGRPETCDIELSSGSAALDQATCQVLMSRLRFRPALDASGRPAPDIFHGTIRWVLPE